MPLLGGLGPLAAMGSLRWSEPDSDFGGLSGLVVAADGTSLIALGDRGLLFHADIRRDAAGRLAAVHLTRQERLLDRNGVHLTPFNSDPEDIAADPSRDGTLWVAFEGLTRVALYPSAAPDRPGRTATPTHAWNRFEPLFGNSGFEALAILPEGRAIAIPERDPGNLPPRVRIYARGAWLEGPVLPGVGSWHVTGAAWGPDNRLWILERRFGILGPKTRIRRFSLEDSSQGFRLAQPEVLLERYLGPQSIWEGIAVRSVPAGIVVMLVSDDNGRAALQTRVSEFFMPINMGP